MNKTITQLKEQVTGAVKPSIKSATWILKLMIPIMLGVSLLDYYGVIAFISQYTAPLFNLIGLDGKAAFVFITSSLANIYSAIGVMALFDFSFREATIMASICLISHNLIIEGIIQSRSGVTFWGITLLRIVSGLFCGYILNLIIPDTFNGSLYLEVVAAKSDTLLGVIESWAITTLYLSVKVILIIFGLNILQNLLRAYNLITLLTSALSPIITLLGLPRSTTFLWIVANTLGLAYGGAVIVDEISKGEITDDEASLLNISISQTHSLVEDTILFVLIGISVWWLILPRLTLSIITVWCERGLRKLRPAKG